MGRLFVYSTIAGLAAFVVLFFLVIERGGGSSAAVMPVSVHDLSVAPQAHADERVETTGVLRRVQEPEEHFLVTEDGLGVLVRGYPASALRALAGHTVTVSGRFGYDATEGTYIEAETVTLR